MRLLSFLVLVFLMACQSGQIDETTSETKTEAPPQTETAVDLATKLGVDTSLFETFEYAEADTSYLMKKYFMVFLKEGPTRNQGEEEAAEIQKAHLAHMENLAKENKICIAGPFAEEGDIQGIVIYSASSKEEAIEMTSNDPAVKAGRLVVEVHPFWAAVGSALF